jgi:fructan beta-fructosidase
VRASDDRETVIGYLPASCELFVDRTSSGQSGYHPDFAGTHWVKLEAVNNRIKLHIYVDSSSVEVFANDGIAVITDLIYPEPHDNGLKIYASDESVVLHSLQIFTMGDGGQPA